MKRYTYTDGVLVNVEIVPEDPQDVRNERNRRLIESDWVMMPDVNIFNKQAWLDYRQALRDVTEQTGFPDDVEWPLPPT